MTDTTLSEKCCGTCAWWKSRGLAETHFIKGPEMLEVGDCDFPVDYSVIPDCYRLEDESHYPHENKDCSCWKAKTDVTV